MYASSYEAQTTNEKPPKGVMNKGEGGSRKSQLKDLWIVSIMIGEYHTNIWAAQFQKTSYIYV